jgi:hypothetical protein
MSYAASEFWREAFAVAVVARYDFSADLAADASSAHVGMARSWNSE